MCGLCHRGSGLEGVPGRGWVWSLPSLGQGSQTEKGRNNLNMCRVYRDQRPPSTEQTTVGTQAQEAVKLADIQRMAKGNPRQKQSLQSLSTSYGFQFQTTRFGQQQQQNGMHWPWMLQAHLDAGVQRLQSVLSHHLALLSARQPHSLPPPPNSCLHAVERWPPEVLGYITPAD